MQLELNDNRNACVRGKHHQAAFTLCEGVLGSLTSPVPSCELTCSLAVSGDGSLRAANFAEPLKGISCILQTHNHGCLAATMLS